MDTVSQTDTGLQRLADLLDHPSGHTVVMLTLAEPPDRLVARPMTLLRMDGAGTLWFLASRRTMTPLVDAGERGTPVNLGFQEPGRSVYVSVAGDARLDDDPLRKADLWTLAARPWFDGPEDPDLVLLAVRPAQVDIWDGPHGTVSRAFAMAASVVAGREIGLGHKETHHPG